jgi:hypothetical protein
MSKAKEVLPQVPLMPAPKPIAFIPLGFVLKYDPPVIGLLYRPKGKGKDKDKRKMYTIHLNNLIFLAEPEDIVEALFNEHPAFLDPNIIKPEQVHDAQLWLGIQTCFEIGFLPRSTTPRYGSFHDGWHGYHYPH